MALPNGYKRVAYIQSSGTQYIDTGFKPNNNTRVVMDINFVTKPSAVSFCFGARNGSFAESYCVFSRDTEEVVSTFGAYNDQKSFGFLGLTERSNIDKNKNTCTINSTSVTHTAASFTSPVNLYLFATNDNGKTDYYSTIRLYGCQIYDNGTLVRNLIPCKNSSATVGMYDDVNGVFYANEGSGSFVAGPEVVDEYKIVNATELDGAITATADAIRAKTGSSEKIVWDATRGFANAIPSGSRVATGTVDITGQHWLNSSPVTVSGLGFTPSFIIMYASPDDIVEANNDNDYGQAYMDGNALYTIYSEGETRTVCPALGEEDGYDEDTGEEWIYEYSSANVYGDFVLTPTADGFKISSTDVNINYWYDMKAHYIALG